MHDRGAIILPPLEESSDVERRALTQGNLPSAAVSSLPVMSCMSPLLQAHFLALMPTDDADESTLTTIDDEQGHNRRVIAQETARLATEEIAAMERAVGELEQYVVLGNIQRRETYTHDPTADESELSDDNVDEEDNGVQEDESNFASLAPIATLKGEIEADESNKRRRV
ncbi:hypothetical protein MPSEU_000560200 [Mayamaea pseudoterrestris]|nr:hypothetical protein MPSEU_000560200 [Mayamaea pseudoterrestris]